MSYTAEYLSAFIEKTKDLLPSWMVKRIHEEAKSSSGGRATANRRAEKSDLDDLLDELVTILDPDGDGTPDADDPTDQPDEDDEDRLDPEDAAAVALRALWRHYEATHFPPMDGDGDYDYDTYGPSEGMRAYPVEFGEEVEKAGPPGTNQYGPPGTHAGGDAANNLRDAIAHDPQQPATVTAHPTTTTHTHSNGKTHANHPKSTHPKAHNHAGKPKAPKKPRRHKAEIAFWKADDSAEQIVYGVVLLPEYVDSQGDVISADEIEAAAHKFLTCYRESGIQHIGDALPSLEVIESYIAPMDLEVGGNPVPKGAWVMAVRISDPEIWQMVLDGKLTGFSIQGWASAEAEEAA